MQLNSQGAMKTKTSRRNLLKKTHSMSLYQGRNLGENANASAKQDVNWPQRATWESNGERKFRGFIAQITSLIIVITFSSSDKKWVFSGNFDIGLWGFNQL